MIDLLTPKNGTTISLHTPFQKEFIRDGRKYLTHELDLQHFRDQILVDTSYPCKTVFTWTAHDALTSTLEISKSEDFSEIFMSEIGRNRCEVYNLEIGTTYYWRVRNPREESEVFSFSTVDEVPRFMHVDGTTNVRDIGGFVTEEGNRIRQGLMFRGGELDMHVQLSEEGKKTMHDTLGIKCDIDLRGEAIGFSTKSPVGDDVCVVQVPLHAYQDFIKDGNKEQLNTVFNALADENNYPLYFHCWGGADRTGCIAFTVEAILGLDEENLMKNFELTCLSGFGNIKNRDEEGFAEMVKALKNYGRNWKERMTNFLVEFGISIEKIEKIRQIMLEKP